MKPCETCKHFNMKECDYCNVDAYVEDGKPCPQYTTSCNPERLLAMLENAQVVATEICEKSENCDSSCDCCLHEEGKYIDCLQERLWHLYDSLKHKLKKKSNYRKDAKDD